MEKLQKSRPMGESCSVHMSQGVAELFTLLLLLLLLGMYILLQRYSRVVFNVNNKTFSHSSVSNFYHTFLFF